ncbi:HGxxPAAW family protein [Streptomyces sp. NPDC005963]|uniref:HGxxPAAW family protein n=1 Tax=Streptomyces sp. NPDC005963 TaxID=3156721 RepID=UPI0033C2183B
MSGTAHGHTPAAWTGVTIGFLGFCVSGVFMVAANPLGFWAGLVIVALGGVVGGAMKAAGLGMPKESADRTAARDRATQVARSKAQPATADTAV